MFEAIVKAARETPYDFRETAFPQDPLAHLFPEWVDYYRTKWAIAHVLQPSSMLEIGVRYGYSAAAFLNGNPAAHYLGIDLDSNDFGGVKGAINWAKQITTTFHAEYLVGDTQQMKCFPGPVYDLIHVDGQQDGDGSYHDLQLAVRQGRYILADGFFWTEQNFQAINQFLYRYRDAVEFYGVIPGYAGELLIKVAPEHLASAAAQPAMTPASSSIRETYTSSYYLQDCGGFPEFKRSGGKRLDDLRLRAVASLAGSKTSGRVLDLGCGRGELSRHFAERGFEVTAIDYSDAAIRLAENCFDGEPDLRRKVELICGDVCTVPLQGHYDVVIASDIIEHLSPEELEVLYARVSGHLAKDGIFAVHTYPNLWYFKYDYARRAKTARSVGAWLPKEPRTRYELLMHINEQSPRVLKRSLKAHFSNVLLWFGEPAAPGGSLLERFSRRQMCAARDLFAIGSHGPIEIERLKMQFQSLPLPAADLPAIRLGVRECPAQVGCSGEFEVMLEIDNPTSSVLASYPPHPVNISYHWMDESGTDMVVSNGLRSMIWPPLNPGGRQCLPAHIQAPAHPGNYLLRLTLVQEGVRWFDSPPINVKEDRYVAVM